MLNKRFYIDTGRDNTFASGLDNVTAYVENSNWTYGHTDVWQPVAPTATLGMTINNSSGKFSQVDTGADYYGKLRKGTLVKVTVFHDYTETTMCVLKIDSVRPISTVKYGQEYQFQITCIDPTVQLYEKPVNIPLLEDVRGDEILTSIIDQTPFVYPYDSAYFNIGTDSIDGTTEIYDYASIGLTDFEQAYVTVPFSGDATDRGKETNLNQMLGDVMLAERTGLLFWDVKAEALSFKHRYHNKIAVKSPYSARTSSATFTPEQIASAQKYSQQVMNSMDVNYYPRKIGAASSIVANKRNVPFVFRAQDTKTFKLRYYDPDNDSALVGAKDVIIPQNSIDIIANSAEDGSGSDWSEFLILQSFMAHGEFAEVTYFNRKVGDPAYVTTMQLRGTPIIAYQKETVTVTNHDSRYLYDKQERTDNVRLISDFDTATEYGVFWTNVLSTNTQYFRSITIPIKDSTPASVVNNIVTLEPGDVITVRDEYYTDKDYMIVGISHSDIAQRDTPAQTTYMLRPVENAIPFIIDESSINGTDLIIT